MNLEEYAEFIVKSICKEPDMIRVQKFQEEDLTILEIMVPERVANSIRVLLQAYAYLQKLGKIRVNIESF